MAKVLRVAAVVVAIAAAIPSGGTSLLGAGLMQAGIAATATAASAIAGGLAIGLNLAVSLTAKKPKVSGVQTSWSADPDAAIPIIFGRTLMSGDIRYRKQHGDKNKYDTIVSVLSGCGPINGLTQTYMEKEPISFSGGMTGVYKIDGHDRIWQRTQLGACPEPSYLAPVIGTPPQWTSAHKLSGYAAVLNTFLYDAAGDHTLTSTPRFNWLGEGVLCYDPRLDSTYPGGSGTCRWNDPSTWVYSECGWIQAITFAIGWHQGPSNVRVGGVGMDVAAIDVPTFVEAANIADANGWKSGGRVTTADDKWEVMKSLAQAGGGEPIRYGAILSCFINAPRVSIGTIGIDDVIGQASISTAQSIRDRVNGITPRYTSEDHFWEQVPAGTVVNTDYLATDKRERTKMVAYPMVQCRAGETPDQVAQLAAYDIANAREAGPHVVPLKLRFLGYRAGDCLTIEDHPAFGHIAGKDVIVTKRQIDPTSATVTLTLRTETPTKHDWALSRVGTPAPMTDSTTPPPFSMEPPTLLTLVSTSEDRALISVRAPTTPLLAYTVFFVGDTDDFNAAIPMTPRLVDAPGTVFMVADEDVEGGSTRYYWAVAYTADDIPSDPTGPLSVKIGAFDYSAGALPVGASLTRASAGSYRNASGAWANAAADAARFSHRYTIEGWQLGGLLVEPAATNSLLYSQDLTNAAWQKTGATATAGRLTEDGSFGGHFISQAVNYTSGDTYCLSVEAAEVTSSPKRYLTLLLRAPAFGGVDRYAKFDLASGVVTYAVSGVTAGIEAAGPGKWRCWISATATATVSTGLQVRLNDTSGSGLQNYTGTTGSLDITDMQLEVGSKPTSRIVTASAAATRAADVAVLDWGTRHVADGAITVRYSFDDGSTQDVVTTVATGKSTIPTNLNRAIIAKAERML